ncbi:MAG: hypothetical protein JO341_10455, partial [Gammaproteobacteria bacterium]|nr:hypothetical protein [Gammaproteobacteria bacterium]
MRQGQSGPSAADADGAALEAEHRALKARLETLTEQVGRNEALLKKTQERELELL